ncbi:uncharacterized protein LOC129597180 isoform X1 [Paramacrobiotus metropolitanus]|uniref:uncharacterized protein LOC129597180 isoform X1 n=1 Tax=Paramacrobiotus metropolitanus TaxID=2943436 RepID=UPI0024462B76|nr:uncharacterized protein LOC129597180 isoform X1 [Paramacrobiotus metropolitanus]
MKWMSMDRHLLNGYVRESYRFLPHCAKKAKICPYFHPVCRNGKHCRFGATCVFDHSGASPAEGPNKQAPPVPTKIPFCIYAPFCTQPRCKLLHKQPVVCTFGAQCRMGAARCAFLHPEDLADGGSTVGDRSDLQITDLEEDSEFEADVTGGDAESVEGGQFTVSAPHPEMDQPEPMPI